MKTRVEARIEIDASVDKYECRRGVMYSLLHVYLSKQHCHRPWTKLPLSQGTTEPSRHEPSRYCEKFPQNQVTTEGSCHWCKSFCMRSCSMFFSAIHADVSSSIDHCILQNVSYLQLPHVDGRELDEVEEKRYSGVVQFKRRSVIVAKY